MNFAFINPPRKIAGNNIWSIINSQNPPLGIALLSAIWDKQGHSSQIIDAAALRLSIPEILSQIAPDTRYAGITATTPEISSAIAIARAMRKKMPHIKIVMGGVHPTIFHDELVKNDICDMVVRNEGELPIKELSKETSCHLIPNLTWKSSSGDVIINSACETYVDLNDLPFPAYDKLPMQLYHSALGAARKEPSIGMTTSRGCPGTCTFCSNKMFGSQTRFMSPVRMMQHIELLQNRYGIREISFYDDTFTTNQDRVIEFCRLIIAKNNRLSWSCFARVDTVNPELLILMNKAGCHQIMYGFETTDETILKNIKKRTKINQFQDVIQWSRKAKINVRGAFMLGNPGETITSMKKTIAFAKKSNMPFAIFNITTPYPGTDLYEEYSRKGLLLHRKWDLYNLAEPVLKLDTVSEQAVKQYYYKSYRTFYLRPIFIFQHFCSLGGVHQLLTFYRRLLRNVFRVSEIILDKVKKRFNLLINMCFITIKIYTDYIS